MIAKILTYTIIFVSEAYTCKMHFDLLFTRKSTSTLDGLSFLSGYVLLLCLIPFDNILLNTIAFAVVNAALLLLNYQSTIGKSLMNAAFLSVVRLSSEMLAFWALTKLFGDTAVLRGYLPAWAVPTLLSKPLFFLVVLLVVRLFSRRFKQETTDRTGRTVLLWLLPLFSIVIISTLFYADIEIGRRLSSIRKEESAIDVLIYISMLLVLLVNVIVLFISNRMQQLADERLELQVAHERESAQIEYYMLVKEQYERQRELVHDIRNHFQTIHDLSEKGDVNTIARYVEQMENDPSLNNRMTYCSNPVLNVILVRYAAKCRQANIVFTCDIRDRCLETMTDKDVSIVFHNILENAFEAAEQSQEKEIELSVFTPADQKWDVISVSNSCDTTPVEDETGLFVTSKSDHTQHGVGLKSVQRVVNSYDASMMMHYDEDSKCFLTNILIPR